MKKLFSALLAVFALAVLSEAARAQFRPQGRYRPDAVSALARRVHEDLDRGYRKWRLSNGDVDRLTRAEYQLREFAGRWRDGRFDKRKLDDSIAAVQHVIDNNRLRGPERDALWNDVEQLRRMREAYDRHEIGYR